MNSPNEQRGGPTHNVDRFALLEVKMFERRITPAIWKLRFALVTVLSLLPCQTSAVDDG